MSHDRLQTGCLLLAVAFMTAACGEPAPGVPAAPTGEWSTAGCELPRAPQVTTVGSGTMPVTPPALEAAMARIDDGGRADFPHSYAGLEVDQHAVLAIVYRVPSLEFDDFVRHSAEDTCVVVRDAAHSMAELTDWQELITADLGMWAERGIRISSIGARHDGVGVEIGTQDVERAGRELPAHYGRTAPLVLVEQGPVVPLPMTATPMTGPPTAPRPGG